MMSKLETAICESAHEQPTVCLQLIQALDYLSIAPLPTFMMNILYMIFIISKGGDAWRARRG